MFTLLLAAIMATTPTPTGQPGDNTSGQTAIQTQRPVVTFQRRNVPPPSALYITRDDVLVADVASSQASETVTVSYRLFVAESNRIVAGQFTVQPGSTRAVAKQTQSLAEGYLLSVAVQAAAAYTRGQTFARVYVNNTAHGAGVPSYVLMADYVTAQATPGFPNGRVLAPSEGPGYINRYQTGLSAGLELDFPVPLNARWRIMALYLDFVTAAGGSNRVVSLVIKGNQTATVASVSTVAQAPSTTGVYLASAGAQYGVGATNDFTVLPLPPNLIVSGLDATSAIKTQTTNLASGDQYVDCELSVEEWIDNV